MTNALVIDTSSAYCSLAVQAGEQVFARHEELGRRHNEEALQMLDGLLSEARLTPQQLDVVGFNAGPGSFTGVRIAAAVSQAIAYAADANVVTLTSSQAVVQSLLYHHIEHPGVGSPGSSVEAKDLPGWIVSWPSRAELYYLSAYCCKDGVIELSQSEQLLAEVPDWAQQMFDDGWGLTGVPAPWLADAAAVTLPQVPEARAQLPFVLRQFEAGQAVPAQEALPVYLPEDSPWRVQS